MAVPSLRQRGAPVPLCAASRGAPPPSALPRHLLRRRALSPPRPQPLGPSAPRALSPPALIPPRPHPPRRGSAGAGAGGGRGAPRARGARLRACVPLSGLAAPLRSAPSSSRRLVPREAALGWGRPHGGPARGRCCCRWRWPWLARRAGERRRGAVEEGGVRGRPAVSLTPLCFCPQRRRAQQHVLREGDRGQAAPRLRHPPPPRLRR